MYERALLAILKERVIEPRKFMQVIVGPRQVGKTTLLNQLGEWLTEHHKQLPVFIESADAVKAPGADWLERVWENARTAMRLQGAESAVLVIDEIQRIRGWNEVVKKNWDLDTRNKLALKVFLSGSSRLLLQEGLGESLTGRFELNYLGHWSFCEMRDAFGFDPEHYVWFGAYPGAAQFTGDEQRFKAYITGSIIETSLNRDIFLLSKIDKPALLRQLFELGIDYTGQIVSYNKMLAQLQDSGNTTTLARYLRLLDQAGLLGGLEQDSTQPIRRRASSPKYQVHNMALYSASQTESFDEVRLDSARWGRLIESAVGAHLLAEANATPNARLLYWRNRDTEVDFVLKYGSRTLALEVKSAPGDTGLRGLNAFKAAFPTASTLLVGGSGIPWQDFLKTSIPQLFAAIS
jgi:predicted AAA+ superfamily ATPase